MSVDIKFISFYSTANNNPKSKNNKQSQIKADYIKSLNITSKYVKIIFLEEKPAECNYISCCLFSLAGFSIGKFDAVNIFHKFSLRWKFIALFVFA